MIRPGIRRLLRLPGSARAQIDRETDEEVQLHLLLRAERLERDGYSPEAARREAARRFGPRGEAQRSVRRSARRREERQAVRNWLQVLWQDLRYGARAAVRAPLFSLLAIVSLALGIGANAAVFGVVKSVLLDALPYADADRLVRVDSNWEASPSERQSVSPGVARDIAERLRSASHVTAFYPGTFDETYHSPAGPKLLSGALVDGRFFSTLGVRAALGRVLTEQDEPQQVVMLSDAAWKRDFGADPGAVGEKMRIGDETFEVVGVLPPGFVGPVGEADLWFALDLTSALQTPASARGEHWLGVVARLEPGATAESAQAELSRLGTALAREHPESDRGRTLTATSLRESMVGDTRTPLLVLMASSALVLLITCANLAGALLSRTLTRRKEFAVRVALGARRGRLVRQLLTESTLLALTGAAVGLLLAVLGLALLRRLDLPALPPYADLTLDIGAFAATLVVALVTGMAFGIAPALAAGRLQPQGTLREESRGASEGRRARRLRGLLVASQVALSLSLLAGAGMLGQSFWAMMAAPLGFEPRGVLTARVALPSSSHPTVEGRAVFFDQLRERIAALPGVESVAITTQVPSSTMSANALTIEGITLPGDGPTFIPYQSVSDEFFGTLRTSLLQGRTFGPQDGADSPPAIVINQTLARRYWAGGGAIGARIRVSPHTSEAWGTIVGIVADVRADPALTTPEPMAYGSYRQDDSWSGRDFLVRTTGDPVALIRLVERELAAMDPSVPLRNPETLESILSERLSDRRLPVLLMTAFGALALLLVSVGIYALFMSVAAAREREFGVRMALGSSRGAIARLVVRQGASWMVLGLLGGAAGVALITRALQRLPYEVSGYDPLVLGGALTLLTVCAAVAILTPVRRATGVDPAVSMRAQ